MKLGIVGLPNVGKSTLFNSMTKAGAEAANYPFCTIDPNIGVVAIPDDRLAKLKVVHGSEKVLPAAIEFVDIAGLVEGASKGEGLGNKFLSHIREVDAIVHVVRCFEDDNVSHVSNSVDPIRDIEIINMELILSDIELVERRVARVSKQIKADKSMQIELNLLETIQKNLEEGLLVRSLEWENEEEELLVKSFNLLSNKPVIYAANTNENDLMNDGADNENIQKVREYAKNENSIAFVLSAKIEEEISQLDDDEKSVFLEELGLQDSGLDKLIKASYELLGLISYLTAGPKEVRAWTIKEGTKAPQAAGVIHTDFERGFIRAEVVSYDALIELGNMNLAKEKGLVKSEGKDYVVKDGDVILFRFNV